MRRLLLSFVLAAFAVAAAVPAYAQGGGASSTGTIQGRATDAQGAVLPGVTVTATSPALLARRPRSPRKPAITDFQRCHPDLHT